MKRIIIVGLALALGAGCFAQAEPTSKIEEFAGQYGVLLIKEFRTLADIDGKYGTEMEISILTMTDAGSGKNIKGMRITASSQGTYKKEEKTAFMGPDEVTSLIAALQYMTSVKDKVGTDKMIPYTEYVYKAKENFEIGFFIDNGEYTVYASVGSLSPIGVYLDYSDLAKILLNVQIVQAAISKT